MPVKLLNLDEITSEDKRVRIGGVEYIIPGDLPVDMMLLLIDNSNKLQADVTNAILLKQGIDILVDVFKIRKPDLDGIMIRKHLTMNRYTKLIAFVFGGFEEEGKKSIPPEGNEKQS